MKTFTETKVAKLHPDTKKVAILLATSLHDPKFDLDLILEDVAKKVIVLPNLMKNQFTSMNIYDLFQACVYHGIVDEFMLSFRYGKIKEIVRQYRCNLEDELARQKRLAQSSLDVNKFSNAICYTRSASEIMLNKQTIEAFIKEKLRA